MPGGAARLGARASSGEPPGFFVFFLNPAIGLRPEIPGASAADLLDRQVWWLLTVACSAAGVGLLLLAPRASAKVGGAVLLVVPHLAGALHSPRSPDFEVAAGLAPASLAQSFVVAAAATNAAFWLVLGLVAAGRVQPVLAELNRRRPAPRAARP